MATTPAAAAAKVTPAETTATPGADPVEPSTLTPALPEHAEEDGGEVGVVQPAPYAPSEATATGVTKGTTKGGEGGERGEGRRGVTP